MSMNFMYQQLCAGHSQYRELVNARAQNYRLLKSFVAAAHAAQPRVRVVELSSFVDVLHQEMGAATARNEVQPFLDEGVSTLQTLRGLRHGCAPFTATVMDGKREPYTVQTKSRRTKPLYLCGKEFTVDCRDPPREFDEWLRVLSYDVLALSAVHDRARDSITLRLSHNPVLEGRIPMSRAQVIAYDDRRACNLVDIYLDSGDTAWSRARPQIDICNEPRVLPVTCIDEALVACDKNLLSSIVIAKGAHAFPLIETSLPVIIEKYERLLGVPARR